MRFKSKVEGVLRLGGVGVRAEREAHLHLPRS